MRAKWLLVLAGSVIALSGTPGWLQAQGPGGPPPFRGPGGFGRGGFRVIGVEGCLGDGRHAPSGTPGYAAQIVHDRLEAVLSGSPVTHTSTDLAYRDNNGVTYMQITLPPMGNSQTSRTVICINDPNLNIRLVVDPDPSKPSAREYQLPNRQGSPQWNRGGSNGTAGQNPPWSGSNGPNANVSITHPAPPTAVVSQINQFCPDAQTTQVTRKSPNGSITSERVYCPSLFLNLYSQTSDPRGVSTTTATITATGAQVDLSKLPVPYPLLNNYAVTVVTPGARRGAPPPPPQP